MKCWWIVDEIWTVLFPGFVRAFWAMKVGSPQLPVRGQALSW